MKQLTLAAVGFDRYTKTTRGAAFLAEMERVVPWSALCALIEPFYPKPGNGRPPVGVERMLRIYLLQQWFNLSDPAVEEALYDSLVMRRFVGIDLGCEPVPDETTVCRFRHLLEEHDLGRSLFDEVQRQLAAKGLKIARGTIVDATIISAPSSTKNAEKARDPEMHQTKKGNQWYFGMKAHFGVDSRTKLIHAVVATPANVADSTMLPDLLHGQETRVWGDQADRGQRAVIREHAPNARDFTNRRYRHRGVVDEIERAKNRTKSKVRARGEHAIGVIKRVFGSAKGRNLPTPGRQALQTPNTAPTRPNFPMPWPVSKSRCLPSLPQPLVQMFLRELGAATARWQTRQPLLEWLGRNRTKEPSMAQLSGAAAKLDALKWRCIGPPRGGRVVAVAGDPEDRGVFYFGACAGGVWKKVDGGIQWGCVSDGFLGSASIGALALAPSDPNVIYAGTGRPRSGS